MSEPLVSIVIPTLSRLELLVQSILSVTAQDYENIEIVVSNNASRDGTEEFLNRINNKDLIVITNPFTLPLETNVAEAVRRAKGKYMLVLSDDDLISNNYISTMVAAFEADEAVQVGLGRRVLINEKGEVLHQAEPMAATAYAEAAATWMPRYFASPTAHNQINTVFSVFYRRAEWLQCGGQPALSSSFFADTIPFIGVNTPETKVFYAPDALFLYRMHHNQATRQIAAKQTYLGLFQFFEHLRRVMGAFEASDTFRAAIIRYILMMFFGSCGHFAQEERIEPADLYKVLWGFLGGESAVVDARRAEAAVGRAVPLPVAGAA